MLENKVLSGVKCTVQECHYHCGDDKCTANAITVNGKNPHTSEETCCTTFKPDCK